MTRMSDHRRHLRRPGVLHAALAATVAAPLALTGAGSSQPVERPAVTNITGRGERALAVFGKQSSADRYKLWVELHPGAAGERQLQVRLESPSRAALMPEVTTVTIDSTVATTSSPGPSSTLVYSFLAPDAATSFKVTTTPVDSDGRAVSATVALEGTLTPGRSLHFSSLETGTEQRNPVQSCVQDGGAGLC